MPVHVRFAVGHRTPIPGVENRGRPYGGGIERRPRRYDLLFPRKVSGSHRGMLCLVFLAGPRVNKNSGISKIVEEVIS